LKSRQRIGRLGISQKIRELIGEMSAAKVSGRAELF
jgi:hypothetical protein